MSQRYNILVILSVRHPEFIEFLNALSRDKNIHVRIFYVNIYSELRKSFFGQLKVLLKNLLWIIIDLIKVRLFIPSKEYIISLFHYANIIEIFSSKNLKRDDIDIIYGVWLFPGGVSSILLGNRLKKPVIVEAGGYDIQYTKKMPHYGLNSIFKVLLVKRVLEKSDCAIARFLVHKLVMKKIVDKKFWHKLIYVPPAVNVKKLSESCRDSDLSQIKSQLGLNHCKFIVLFAPRMSSLYNPLMFIKAVIYLTQTLSNELLDGVCFLMIGGGELTASIKQLSAKYSIKNLYIWGRVPYSRMPCIYRISDLVCDLCKIGQGTTTLEAFVFGKPVIGIKMPKRLVIPGRLGFLVRNWKELAKGIEKLLTNKELLSEMSKNARYEVVKKYALEKRVSKFKEIILSLMAQGHC